MGNKEGNSANGYVTEQEKFWAGDFGNEYQKRISGDKYVNFNIALFSRILKTAANVNSIAELGCNIGLNLQALNKINSGYKLSGYEINQAAAEKAKNLNIANIYNTTILNELPFEYQCDLVFTKGVLIHINPDKLTKVYENLFSLSKRYIMVCEYYNPTPIVVDYRGNSDRLFKRDFAGDLIEKFDLKLIDYGFTYRRDNCFPIDDLNWFLLEKNKGEDLSQKI